MYAPSIQILRDYQQSHLDLDIVIEGAISYISEPSCPRAWELTDYADYAAEMAALGVNEIAIKDYAGLVDHEIVPLIAAIRKALTAVGFAEMKINLHSHGQKVATLIKTLAGGADKVDVAIGELSGGPSHTNMRDVIHAYLDGKFSAAAIAAHPAMQQLGRAETAISAVVSGSKAANGCGFQEARVILKNLDDEINETYRVAAGALSDLAKRVQPQPNADVLFYKVLDEIPMLWEKSGRPNTVTPGAKIMIDQRIGYRDEPPKR